MNGQNTEYYKAHEAQAKLGLTKAKFHRWVRQGLIPKIVLPGMRQAVYPKRDIDALALSMSSFGERAVLSKSSLADQIAEMNIDIKCFGRSFIFPLPERIAFQQKSEFTFHSLKIYGEVVGYISTFRFPEIFLNDILTGLKIERDITPREVLPFIRLEPFNVYIDMIAVDPDLPIHLRRLYAGMMVFHFIDLLTNLLANDYQITQLYTVATTREGERLVQKWGFQLMQGKSLVASRVAYEYLFDRQGLRHLRALQEAYRKRLHLSF